MFFKRLNKEVISVQKNVTGLQLIIKNLVSNYEEDFPQALREQELRFSEHLKQQNKEHEKVVQSLREEVYKYRQSFWEIKAEKESFQSDVNNMRQNLLNSQWFIEDVVGRINKAQVKT